MEAMLPALNVHVPGSGVTPFNVWDLEFRWWRIYRDAVLLIVSKLK